MESNFSNVDIWVDPLPAKIKESIGYTKSLTNTSGYVEAEWFHNLWQEWCKSHPDNKYIDDSEIWVWNGDNDPWDVSDVPHMWARIEWLSIFESEDSLAFWIMKMEHDRDG